MEGSWPATWFVAELMGSTFTWVTKKRIPLTRQWIFGKTTKGFLGLDLQLYFYGYIKNICIHIWVHCPWKLVHAESWLVVEPPCCLDVIAQRKQETQVGPDWNLAWSYQRDILKSARNPLPNPFNRGVHYNNVLVLRRCHLGPCWCRPCRFPTRRWWPPNSAQSWRTTTRCPPGPRQRSPGTTGA